jgi:GNAT superfamily N-acetyltransferase
MSFSIRIAMADDTAALSKLIARSARELGAADYDSAQIEGALKGAFGVDTQLIADGTYYIVEEHGQMVGCGGWSYRRTLFGGDAGKARDAALLDPQTEAARIRAYFIDPAHARRGIGRALLAHCEAQAAQRGFRRFELMATLTGLPFYARCGYRAATPVHYPLAPAVTIEFVPMSKETL